MKVYNNKRKISMNKSNKKITHIYHPLNQSKSKLAYSFQKSDRFNLAKRLKSIIFSYSPNKFYDLPDTSPRRSPSIGIGNRSSFERIDTVDPGRYRINSCFDMTHDNNLTGRSTTFGISRDVFYLLTRIIIEEK
jgi:hypothetical protein